MKLIRFFPVFILSIILIYACQPPQEKGQERPNIIFIFTDDHTWQAVGAYGSGINETPNIDRLASEGILFRNAFVTNSICAPSRAVILTGKHSHLNGVIDNGSRFDSAQQTFPKILQQEGYQTAMVGKWHLKTQPTGFDYWKVLPGQGNYYNPDFRTPDGRERIEGYVTDIITDEAIHFLENRDPDRPFMLMYQHKAPHRAWWPEPEHFGMYNEKIREPATLFDDYKGRGTAAREQEMEILNHMHPSGDNKLDADSVEKYQITGTGSWGPRAYRGNLQRMTEEQRQAWHDKYSQRNKEFWDHIPDNPRDLLKSKYQYYMQDYLRCIASVDDNIGRLMDYLEENGLAENTLVVYNSDQGFYLGEHGWFDKRFMYEESFRTPLIMRWPAVINPGTESEDLVQNLDIAETLLEAAGVTPPEDMQGESLLPILKGEEFDAGREGLYYHYYEYPSVHMVKRHYGIRTDRYKLIHFYFDVDEWELYDLEKDPNELTSVYDDPDYREVVNDLKAKLEGLMKKYGDSEELRESLLPKGE